MKAMSIESIRKITQVEIAMPVPGPEEVLLQVEVIGLCGTDLSIYRGTNPLASYPRIPGHEIGGKIASCGELVPSEWRPKTTVTCSPYSNCGRCSACEMGRPNACQYNQTLGVQRDGGLTEFIAVPWRRLLHAQGLDAASCAMVEPLAVGWHAAVRGQVKAFDTVLVLGTGVVGLGAIAAAREMGAERVIAVDLVDAKLALASKAGATDMINASVQELQGAIATRTQGRGVSLVIEAAGMPDTFLAAVQAACYGGRVVYVGYTGSPVTYETKHFLLKELDIRGSRGSTNQDLRSVVNILQRGAYPVAESITHTANIEDFASTMSEWDANPGAFTKIHVQVS